MDKAELAAARAVSSQRTNTIRKLPYPCQTSQNRVLCNYGFEADSLQSTFALRVVDSADAGQRTKLSLHCVLREAGSCAGRSILHTPYFIYFSLSTFHPAIESLYAIIMLGEKMVVDHVCKL